MNEAVVLIVEKEQYEEMLSKYNKQASLAFKRVQDNEYRVVNQHTGRFHNIELGIDEVM